MSVRTRLAATGHELADMYRRYPLLRAACFATLVCWVLAVALWIGGVR